MKKHMNKTVIVSKAQHSNNLQRRIFELIGGVASMLVGEKRGLPTIKEMRLGPAAAQLLLAQLAQLLGSVFLVSAAVDESRREARSENGQGGKCPNTFIGFAMLPPLFARASSLLDCPRSASELM